MMGRRIVSTGYEDLDNNLGGGFIKNSTNLVVEDGKCLGELFLASMLKKRMEKGDKGVIDCFSLTPGEIKDFCEKHAVSLKKYANNVHFINLTSEGESVINIDDLDTFAPAYMDLISRIKVKHIFNIVLSLSDFTYRFGEEKTYKHLRENLKVYESCERTSVYLIKRDLNSDKYINRMKDLCSSVILLKQYTAHDRFLSVEKSPLQKSSPDLIGYNIGKELENRRMVL